MRKNQDLFHHFCRLIAKDSDVIILLKCFNKSTQYFSIDRITLSKNLICNSDSWSFSFGDSPEMFNAKFTLDYYSFTTDDINQLVEMATNEEVINKAREMLNFL